MAAVVYCLSENVERGKHRRGECSKTFWKIVETNPAKLVKHCRKFVELRYQEQVAVGQMRRIRK